MMITLPVLMWQPENGGLLNVIGITFLEIWKIILSHILMQWIYN